ncbi:hypothetical protein AIP78_00970 [Salmonella enterica]|nr:hypothetical protein [Salmonella enterica]EAX2241882.1 hypothetical protein [Salmonella enterica]EBA3319821.1 hypothetical protein [Salmonella enterica]EDV4499356.1 hypothetical protein [Salmonella enterica]EGR7452891.1 hypothetical protein [Salmonella enterica]
MIDKSKTGVVVGYGLLDIQRQCQCETPSEKTHILILSIYGAATALAGIAGFDGAEKILNDVRQHLKDNRAQITSEILEMMKPAQSRH